MVELLSGEVRGLRARKITDETCKKFGYMCGEYKNRPVQIAPYYDADGQAVAQKVRFPDKTFLVAGDISEALPFGAQCWPKTGKKIVVTEGEVDALTMSQVQGNKWPVVSISCGAGPQIRKYFAKHKEYFNGFEEVVLMFDMDQPGRDAAKVAAEVLGSRARIADLPLKDANEMLQADRTDELINAMWKAKEYRPEGIVDMAELKAAVMERPQEGMSWPFPTLTKLTFGIRLGEIIALGAGTGVGKTDFFAQTITHFAAEHKVPVGVFSLEQHPTETATRLAGKLAKKTFHIPDSGWTEADFETAWATLMKSGKVFLYDSFGNNDWEVVKEKMEYLHHAHGVRYFFLDHLTALAAWQDDERKALEVIMSEMGSLVKKLDCTIFLISHLATPEGKPHEEGGRVMIRHYKGSRAIGFWSHFVIALERDQQADRETQRKTTTVRVLKDRYTGRSTGEKFYIGYDEDTGMLYETDDDEPTVHGFADETKDLDQEDGF
jgi:twinkle protein